MKRLSRLALLLALAALAALAAPDRAAAADGPCVRDVKRLCGDVEPGEGRVQACIEAKKDQLSAGCRVNVAKVKGDLASAQAACGDDATRLCGDVEPGKGRVLQCLVAHEDQLTADCAGKLDKAGDKLEAAKEKMEKKGETWKEKLEDAHDACAGDAERLCADVEAGGGRIVRCLKAKSSELSAGCRAAL